MPPSVVKCDSATSDVYYTGGRLAQAFENTTSLWTNGTGKYCMSAQEDNATLEVLVRAAIEGLVDFSRVIAMRTGEQYPLLNIYFIYLIQAHTQSTTSRLIRYTPGSNFDRPPPSRTDWEHLTHTNQNGFHIAIANLYAAGIQVVRGILADWDCTFARGVPPTNYIGDIFGSLGGRPDFGFGSITGGRKLRAAESRSGRRGVNRNVVSLAGVEMARRRTFGAKGAMKM